jgi:hypothetical protein
MNFNDEVTFYVRITTSIDAIGSGQFEIDVKADPTGS